MSGTRERTVVEILEERIDILSTLRDLTRRRHDAVERDRSDAIDRLVDARRPLIERLLADAGGLESAASMAASASEAVDPRALVLVEQATALLEEIESLDRMDDAALRTRGDSTRDRLDGLAKTARAGRAYRQATGGGSTRAMGRGRSA